MPAFRDLWRPAGLLTAVNEQAGMQTRDQWSAAYINDLPDKAFLIVLPGGTKDGQGRTDGAHRLFPVLDASGKPDAAHIRNALARIPQASTISAADRATAMAKAKKMAADHPDIGSGPGAGYEGSAGSGRSRTPEPLPAGALDLAERSFGLVMELRDVGGDGRTLYGRLVPYNVVGDVGQFRERFLPGVFSRQLSTEQPGHVKLYGAHYNRLSGQAPIGKAVRMTEQPDGLYGELRVFDTSSGEDALKLVKQDEVRGLSVGFKPTPGGGSRKAADGVIERIAGHLDHVSLTHDPVYPDAAVLSVRSQLPGYDADRERLRAVVL